MKSPMDRPRALPRCTPEPLLPSHSEYDVFGLPTPWSVRIQSPLCDLHNFLSSLPPHGLSLAYVRAFPVRTCFEQRVTEMPQQGLSGRGDDFSQSSSVASFLPVTLFFLLSLHPPWMAFLSPAARCCFTARLLTAPAAGK